MSISISYLLIIVNIICNKYCQWVIDKTSRSTLQISQLIYNVFKSSTLQWFHVLADSAAEYIDKRVYRHG